MKKARSWLMVVVCIAVVGVGAWYVLPGILGSGAGARAESLAETARPEFGMIEATVSAVGSVAAQRDASLAFTTSGQVATVTVHEGDRVTHGIELVKLDTRSVTQQISRAEASLATARARLAQAQQPASAAELASAQASVDAAQAAVESAQVNLDRLYAEPSAYDLRAAQLSVDVARDQLWGAQAQRDSLAEGPASQRDSAESQVHVAEISVQQALLSQERLLNQEPSVTDIASAQAQIDQATAQLGQAEAQLAQIAERPDEASVMVSQSQVLESEVALAQARESLADLSLEAPLGGLILFVGVEAGDWVSPGSPVVTIADLDALRVNVYVDELDIAQVQVDQVVRLRFDALADLELTGYVSHIAPSATQTAGGTAYEVEVGFAPGDAAVRVGMTSNVEIVVDHQEDVILVPNRAIRADRSAKRYYVTVQQITGITEEVEIGIGIRDESNTQVVSGLEGNETLVLPQIDSGAGSGLPSPMGGSMMGAAR